MNNIALLYHNSHIILIDTYTHTLVSNYCLLRDANGLTIFAENVQIVAIIVLRYLHM